MSGCVSLNNDYFRNFCTNNIPVAQFQIASLAEELLSLRARICDILSCDFFHEKKNIDVLLSAVCTE